MSERAARADPGEGERQCGSETQRPGLTIHVPEFVHLVVVEIGVDGTGGGDEEVEQAQELLPPAPAFDEQSRGKEIGRLARPDIEMMIGSKVYLDLWVKVRKDWRNRDAILKSLGFGQD